MKPLRVRFDAKVDRSGGPDACWPWTASVHPKTGYGQMGWVNGTNKSGLAHRIAFELEHGEPIAFGVVICHRCDNRICCNPAHLFAGTQADNMADMHAKGRDNQRDKARGETVNHAKVTVEQVIEIRRLYATTMLTQAQIGARFGLRQTAVSSIISRRTWAHVP